jgi:hypothetical protein
LKKDFLIFGNYGCKQPGRGEKTAAAKAVTRLQPASYRMVALTEKWFKPEGILSR